MCFVIRRGQAANKVYHDYLVIDIGLSYVT